ncbi:MAG TPA: hypothetical protein VHO91_09615 [Rhodopila sp.]|nr:hypothetical protein [Rhodopila sp.]
MRAGDWDAAWAVNDEVLAGRDSATRDDPALPYHLRWVWDGRPFRGRDVLVRCYHGLGDTLQFARYLPPLRQQVASLTVEAQPPLVPLLRRALGFGDPGASAAGLAPVRVVPFVPDRPLPPVDCNLEIMELPHALRLAPADVPPLPLDFLRPEETCRAEAGPSAADSTAAGMSARPDGTAGDASLPADGIGLCWRSGGWDTARDLPCALAASIMRGRNVVALQPGATRLPVLNPFGCPDILSDTAGLVARLRLVVTVDTMVAHLAGTLGRPTFLLLKHDADWRWMERRTDSPWYPSMRLFRQPEPGNWQAVTDAVLRALD